MYIKSKSEITKDSLKSGYRITKKRASHMYQASQELDEMVDDKKDISDIVVDRAARRYEKRVDVSKNEVKNLRKELQQLHKDAFKESSLLDSESAIHPIDEKFTTPAQVQGIDGKNFPQDVPKNHLITKEQLRNEIPGKETRLTKEQFKSTNQNLITKDDLRRLDKEKKVLTKEDFKNLNVDKAQKAMDTTGFKGGMGKPIGDKNTSKNDIGKGNFLNNKFSTGDKDSELKIRGELGRELISRGKERDRIEYQTLKKRRPGRGRLKGRVNRARRVYSADYADYTVMKNLLQERMQKNNWKSEQEKQIFLKKMSESRAKLEKSTRTLEKRHAEARKRNKMKLKAAKYYRRTKSGINSEGNVDNLYAAGNDGIMGSVIKSIKKRNPIEKLKKQIVKYLIGLLTSALSYVMPYLLPFIFAIVIVGGIASALSSSASSVLTATANKYSATETKNVKLTEGEIDEIINARGEISEEQKIIMKTALSKVGLPYSQDPDKRLSGEYFDCSALAYTVITAAGKDILQATAAEQAMNFCENGRVVPEDATELEVGDLIYYGGKDNDRDMGIYHVAIYVGNGYCVEAYDSTVGVRYAPLVVENAVVVCRPLLPVNNNPGDNKPGG